MCGGGGRGSESVHWRRGRDGQGLGCRELRDCNDAGAFCLEKAEFIHVCKRLGGISEFEYTSISHNDFSLPHMILLLILILASCRIE